MRSDEVRALANECAAVWTYIGGHLIEVGERRGGLASLDLKRTEQALREYADLLEAAEELLRLRDAEVTAFPDARYLKAWDRLRKLVRP